MTSGEPGVIKSKRWKKHIVNIRPPKMGKLDIRETGCYYLRKKGKNNSLLIYAPLDRARAFGGTVVWDIAD